MFLAETTAVSSLAKGLLNTSPISLNRCVVHYYSLSIPFWHGDGDKPVSHTTRSYLPALKLVVQSYSAPFRFFSRYTIHWDSWSRRAWSFLQFIKCILFSPVPDYTRSFKVGGFFFFFQYYPSFYFLSRQKFQCYTNGLLKKAHLNFNFIFWTLWLSAQHLNVIGFHYF